MQVKRYYERKNFLIPLSITFLNPKILGNFSDKMTGLKKKSTVPTFLTCSQLWLNCGGTREVRSDVSM